MVHSLRHDIPRVWYSCSEPAWKLKSERQAGAKTAQMSEHIWYIGRIIIFCLTQGNVLDFQFPSI